MKILDYLVQMKILLYKGDMDVTHPELLEEYSRLDEKISKEILNLKTEKEILEIEVQALKARVKAHENYK